MGQPVEGDIVAVLDNHGTFLALGHYQPGTIAVRICSFSDTPVDRFFWLNKFLAATRLRRTLGFFDDPETNVFRLIHAEGDGMPGLIVDNYMGVLVMQFHSVGMYLMKDLFVELLMEIPGLNFRGVYNKSDSTIPHKADIQSSSGWLTEPVGMNEVLENGHRFIVDWEKGQKTGFFIDQRENRSMVGQYARDRSILNMFGYTGGFSVYALSGGAQMVHTVDSSIPAIELAHANVLLNFPQNIRHQTFTTDAFDYLDHPESNYDLIILDPPAFAKHQNVLHQALQGYKRLNLKALNMIQPGGILFTFSCSQAVTRENFRKSVFAAAVNSGRKVRILHQLHQPADHPVSIYHPEGEYLKGLVLHVE